MASKMFLTNLILVFFQRTNFINFQDIGKYIEENVDPFKSFEGKIEVINNPPFPIEQFPKLQIKSNTNNFNLTIYNDRIDLVFNEVCDNNEYDNKIDQFIDAGKQLSSLVASKENLCGRIGIVNDSIFLTSDPNNLILNKFILPSSIKNPTQLILSYTILKNITNFNSNIITTLQPGELKNINNGSGVVIRRDINIKDIQLSIKPEKIVNYLKEVKKLISYKSMESLIYVG